MQTPQLYCVLTLRIAVGGFEDDADCDKVGNLRYLQGKPKVNSD